MFEFPMASYIEPKEGGNLSCLSNTNRINTKSVYLSHAKKPAHPDFRLYWLVNGDLYNYNGL